MDTPDFLLLQWHITHNCDQRCLHCYHGDKDNVESYTKFSQLMRYLLYYQEMLNSGGADMAGHIHITGGDPLLHPEIFPFLEQIVVLQGLRKRFTFAVLAGAHRLDQATARQLARFKPGYVQLSLDGTPATHDRLRGEGSHEKTVAALRWLVEAGIRVVVAFTAHGENWRQFPAVAKLASRLGACRIWADRHIPTGRGEALRDKMLSPEQTRAFCLAMVAKKWPGWSTRPSAVRPYRALQFLTAGGRPYRCEAGHRLLALTPEGVVLPCRRLPLAAGQLGEQSLVEIYRDSLVLQKLRQPALPRGCETCWHQQGCGGGLRCLSHALYQDYGVADPGCWIARHQGVLT